MKIFSTNIAAVLLSSALLLAGCKSAGEMNKQAEEIRQTLPGADVEKTDDGIKIVMKENLVNFDTNSANLTNVAKTNLDKLLPVLTNNLDSKINIYGYTDDKGQDAYNKTLSEKRANAVKNYLVSKGIAKNRISAIGKGEVDPIADNATEDGRAENRRVEFEITANENAQ
ncbi:MAG: OmpA family protein [Flavobacteriaceae bacterium]|jgi:outer membrane protein OmpA-like peptidoglycan-associated protein|nr:OmpA family protein [Flavobacteriaceae bacterium]